MLRSLRPLLIYHDLSCALASSQPHRLAILLQLSDELVALPDNILVLLVLVVRPVGLDDTLACHAVDGARDSTGSDELGKVPVVVQSLC